MLDASFSLLCHSRRACPQRGCVLSTSHIGPVLTECDHDGTKALPYQTVISSSLCDEGRDV